MKRSTNRWWHIAAIAMLATFGVCELPGVSRAGLLFLASYQAGDDPAAIADPRIEGALMTYYWSQIETAPGQCNWTDIDRRIQAWAAAGKKVVLRIVWSADGNWPNPVAKTPTPLWVFQQGAAMVQATRSGTQVPLPWDPIYVQFANRFVQEMANKYDGNPNLLFVDLTPGAESHPYRYSMNATDTGLRQAFFQATASDGSRYSDAIWLSTVQRDIDAAKAAFRMTPVLVTLNEGLFAQIGEYAVTRRCYTGQNGIKGDSYLKPNGPWLLAFHRWRQQTRLYFEMFGPTNVRNGNLMENVLAAQRAGADYLGVYAQDVLKGIPGQPRFDPDYSKALTYGAGVIGR